MPTSGSWARRGAPAAAVAAIVLICTTASAQSIHDVTVVLDRVADRLSQYYRRIQNIVCIERMTAQEVGHDLTPRGFARVVESELRVEAESTDDEGAPLDAKVVRSLVRVNGRAPGPKDREACYDPNPLSDEPLAFLLPKNREDYTFTWGGFGKGKTQNIMFIDFRARQTGRPEMKEHERAREGCLSFTMPGGTKGRVWIDVTTHDVVQVEERLIGPVDFRTPLKIQRRYDAPDLVQLDRFDRFVKYRAVKFDEPQETMLLPESVSELTVFRGGGGSHRTQQVFSNYKRFLTAGRIVK